MSRSATSLRSRVLMSAALAGLLVTGVPGAAGAADPASCLDPVPVEEVVAGLTGTGLTVDRGTDPAVFTATVRGRITDGIALGVDMIIADLDSQALTDAGGVWAGMSGSPVYDESGRLIGAVAYGLAAGPSKIAGITPAVSMGNDLLALGGAPFTVARGAIALPRAIRDSLVRTGAVTPAQAQAGMTRLPTPLAVSGGMSTARLTELAKRLGIDNVRPYAAGSVAAAGDPAAVEPGGNFAAALSYGDLTIGAVGTTTAVCDGEALAFGHPVTFSGRTTLSAHGADAVYVQPDSLGAPFKVANITGAVGVVDQDRRVGIHSSLGVDQVPATVPVTSHVTFGSRVRDGRTDINVPDFLPDLAAFHLLSNADRVFDQVGPGTSELTWTAHGTRADGRPWRLTRANRFASADDITFESTFELFDDLAQIASTPDEDVKISDVDIAKADLDETLRRYSITSVAARMRDGRYEKLTEATPLTVVAGSQLNLRVTLTSYRGIDPSLTANIGVGVPAGAHGGFGELVVAGGRDADLGGEFDDLSADPAAATANALSFDALLHDLASVARNDDLSATLTVEPRSATGKPITRTGRRSLDSVVTGLRFFPVEVVAPGAARPGHVDGGRWSLRHRLSTGKPSTQFTFGTTKDVPVMGDWNGNGTVSAGAFRAGRWTLRTGRSGDRTFTVTLGKVGDQPVVGDWNGDGNDDVGVYSDGVFSLRTIGALPIERTSFTFDPSGSSAPSGATARAVAGDWNGDGIDTVGTVAGGVWRVADGNTAAAKITRFRYGVASDRPVVGDWDADGLSEPGVYRAGRWVLTRRTFGGPAAIRFDFGEATSRPVVWR